MPPSPKNVGLIREIAVAHFREVDKLTFKQIGDRLGINRDKAKTIYGRALRKRMKP